MAKIVGDIWKIGKKLAFFHVNLTFFACFGNKLAQFPSFTPRTGVLAGVRHCRQQGRWAGLPWSGTLHGVWGVNEPGLGIFY